MGTRQIRVSEDLYARIESAKRPDETLGEALERLVDNYTLEDFAADTAPVADAWDTGKLEADFEESDRQNREELDEQLP